MCTSVSSCRSTTHQASPGPVAAQYGAVNAPMWRLPSTARSAVNVAFRSELCHAGLLSARFTEVKQYEGADTLKSDALSRRAVASCCGVTRLGLYCNSNLHTSPTGRCHSTMGQHDAGCCVVGSVFPCWLFHPVQRSPTCRRSCSFPLDELLYSLALTCECFGSVTVGSSL